MVYSDCPESRYQALSVTTSTSLIDDLLRHLRAARLEARIYDANHPRRQDRAEQLRALMVSAASGGALVIEIEGEEILVNGQVVEDSVTRDLMIVFREKLIRVLRVQFSVRLEEVVQLVELLISPVDYCRTSDEISWTSEHIDIEHFTALLELDRLGNRVEDGRIDLTAYGDFSPEQVAAIRMVTADDRVRSKIQRIEQSETDTSSRSVDFIERFFRLVAADAGTDWADPNELAGTLIAGLDLVHEAQSVQQETGALPEHLFTDTDGMGSQLQARFRWKLLGSMFGADQSSPRTAEEAPGPSEGLEIDTEDLHMIAAGRFPCELGELITGSLSPLVELEMYAKTLSCMSQDGVVDTDSWHEVFADVVTQRPDFVECLHLFATRLNENPDLLEFFQKTLVHASILRLLPSDLAVALSVNGQVRELDNLLACDPVEVLSEDSVHAGGPFGAILTVIRTGDVRALDVAYLLVLRGSPDTRWGGGWGRWLIDRVGESRAVGAWLKRRVDTVFDPEQQPFFFSLSEEVITELKEVVTDLEEETLLRFLNAFMRDADRCPLGYLASATRHSAPSVRSLAVQCLAKRTDSGSVGILFHRLQTCGVNGAGSEELNYIFEGLEQRDDVDIGPRLKEIISSRVGLRFAWPKELRERAKLARRRIKKARRSRG